MTTPRNRAIWAFILFCAPVVGCSASREGASAEALAGAGATEGDRRAILAALEDERKSEAFYEWVMASYGRGYPMQMLANQERCHQRWLHALAARQGVELPAVATPTFEPVGSFADACLAGAQAERENVALYDRLLAETDDPDVRATFERLRWVSLERHLPALERAARSAS